jgi:predicted amidohydrolase YtcJ
LIFGIWNFRLNRVKEFKIMQAPIRKESVAVADTVYLNGNIYTVDERNKTASAMAIKNDRFVFVGSDEAAKDYIGTHTTVFDLKSKTVLPGLIDAHVHYSGVGISKMKLDTFWKSKHDILDTVVEAVKTAKKGEWIEGRGWNQEVWDPPNYPTRADLDAVAPDHPVYLERTDGHAAWVNSKALEITGIAKETLNPPGGEVIKDIDGVPTGLLVDTAKLLVFDKIPPFTEQKALKTLETAQEEFLSNGLTSVHDAGCDIKTLERIKRLYESGQLYMRLYEYMRIPDGSTTLGDEFYASGKQIGLYNNSLTIRGIKISIDGALGSHGAFMLEGFSDRSDGYQGLQRVTRERLLDVVKQAHEVGFQTAVHAIGDAANRQALDVFDQVLRENPKPDHRHRIEHAQIVALEDIPRFNRLGIVPSMQAVHATSDKNMAEKRVGPQRIKGTYAWRKFLDTGAVIPNGTDAPVEMVNPFHGLFASVTRQSRDGEPPGGWYPEEKMTREEALKSYTLWPAYAAFEENIKGSISEGKLADFIVIDRDYMTCGESKIKDIRVLQTILGGRVVFPVKQNG